MPARRLTIFVPHASDWLTDHRAHGDGLVGYEIVSRLARRGHEVHVAAPRIDIGAGVPKNLHLHPLPIGLRHSALGRLGYMRDVRRLFETLDRKHAIDVIHQLNPVFTGISLALFGTRLPLVLGSFVGDWPKASDATRGLGARIKRGIAAVQQRQAKALLVTTPAAVGRIPESARLASRIFTMPHGIDPAGYDAVGSVPPEPSILFLGGLEVRKGIFTLLDAFERVAKRSPDCRLVIAGEGGQWDVVCRKIARMEAGDRITMLGRVKREQIPQLMRECTLYCMPSHGEPFGMSLLEAMASSKPVVVTDAGGAAHIVEAGGGRKVPVGEAEPLAEAMLDILASPQLQVEMGAFNRARIEKNYAWESVIDQLEAIYASLVPVTGARS